MTTPDSLRDERLDALLDAVLGQNRGADPRATALIGALIVHDWPAPLAAQHTKIIQVVFMLLRAFDLLPNSI